MKKHFMCTHAFFDDDAKQAFEVASNCMTDRQIFEMMKGEKAEMLGHWRGNDDFFFCHWYAESEQVIIDKLASIGADDLFITMAVKTKKPIADPEELDKMRSQLLEKN